MSESFVIDIWSDVVCPFCYLGTRQLAEALADFEHRDAIILRHRAFELDPTNTLDAHRVIALASSQGLGGEASERLFRAYFCEGELVSDHRRLSELAREVGVSDADTLWESDAFTDVVRGDEAHAQELGITGVPCFLMDSKFIVNGAQGSAQILDLLRRAWARRAA